MTTWISQCAHCTRFFKGDQAGRFCVAFPAGEGIPLEIWENRVFHTKDYPGDSGIHYEVDKSSLAYKRLARKLPEGEEG